MARFLIWLFQTVSKLTSLWKVTSGESHYRGQHSSKWQAFCRYYCHLLLLVFFFFVNFWKAVLHCGTASQWMSLTGGAVCHKAHAHVQCIWQVMRRHYIVVVTPAKYYILFHFCCSRKAQHCSHGIVQPWPAACIPRFRWVAKPLLNCLILLPP